MRPDWDSASGALTTTFLLVPELPHCPQQRAGKGLSQEGENPLPGMYEGSQPSWACLGYHLPPNTLASAPVGICLALGPGEARVHSFFKLSELPRKTLLP